jgi:predicted amidohydrolase
MSKPATPPAYVALALQTTTDAVAPLSVAAARESITAAIDRIGRQLLAAKMWHGPGCRLVVLPEYAFTGFPMGGSIAEWAEKAALDPDGQGYDTLAGFAQRAGVFLAVNAYETDRHFPGVYFQACVILGPTGDLVLRYRRLHSLYSPSPYDYWDRYLDHYGIDAVLPVARTELGALAAIASEEILYPELARALALRGAEVFVHPTSEASSPELMPKAVARRARAIENLAYVVSANSGGIRGTDLSGNSTDGGSEILDHLGRVLARAGSGESVNAATELDLGPLRRARSRPTMANLLSRVATGLWSEEYARHDVQRPNGLVDAEPERSYFQARQEQVIARLRDAGVVQ